MARSTTLRQGRILGATLASNEGLLESWQLSLRAKAPGTTTSHLRTARWFADWLEAQGWPSSAPGDLLAVTRQDAGAWFGAQRAEGLTIATLRSRWIALRNLYDWAHEEEESRGTRCGRFGSQ
jgi:site-specific recombinase XerD